MTLKEVTHFKTSVRLMMQFCKIDFSHGVYDCMSFGLSDNFKTELFLIIFHNLILLRLRVKQETKKNRTNLLLYWKYISSNPRQFFIFENCKTNFTPFERAHEMKISLLKQKLWHFKEMKFWSFSRILCFNNDN